MSSPTSQATAGPVAVAWKRWFGQPPRAHGEIDPERTVSFLELFYDLVFVVLIAQIAHTLAGNIGWGGVFDFAVVFGLIWMAWFNGTLYHELHGREDGRSRTYIFGQMLFLVVLAVYAAHATEEDGRGFALVYALLLLFLTLQWYGVRAYDSPEWHGLTARYIGGMVVAAAVVGASAFLDEGPRLVVWTVVVLAWLVLSGLQMILVGDERMAIGATESLAERYGLFIIIVLGEVVVGVVDGLSEAERDFTTIATGLLALITGFGFWWNYFDFAGRRVPRTSRWALATWLGAHLPLAGSVAAAGAGMVGLIEHAGDGRTPAATAWLIGGAIATALVFLAVVVSTIDYDDVDSRVVRPTEMALVVGAAGALALAGLRPTPWLLALALTIILVAVWAVAFSLRATSVASAPGRPVTT